MSGAYVIVSPTGATKPFALRGYAGSSGRLDVVARCIIASSIEPSAAVYALLLGPPNPPKLLVAPAGCCAGLRELELMADMSRALKRGEGEWLHVRDQGLEELLGWLSRDHEIVLLEERGKNALLYRELVLGRKAMFLGSHLDMPPEALSLVRRYAKASVSVGPRSLHADHVVAFLAWLRSQA
ncbi:MAG: hypothetical protein N3F67_01495 [Acidilobaceae archaeon]|nr:hypothetical protein [Acidilobaceae archaeon]